MVYLSREDWVEIYYALECKMGQIDDDKRWAGHLYDVMETIGSDGETAADEGVAKN